MNKFWSVLFFAICLVLTWTMIHSSAAIGSETHSGIQSQLAKLIVQTLEVKKPEAKNLRVTRLWTESMDENKVRAVFAYAYEEQGATPTDIIDQTIEGEAILHREPSEDARQDKWILQQVHTTNNQVNFTEGTVVTPEAGPDEGADTPPPAHE